MRRNKAILFYSILFNATSLTEPTQKGTKTAFVELKPVNKERKNG
jgi:hypothetical protein